MKREFGRVVVSGDVLRPAQEAWRPGQLTNIAWFHRLTTAAVARAMRLRPEVVAWDRGFDTVGFYVENGTDTDLEGWASVYDADQLSVPALALINHAYYRSLIIGYELPPVLKRAFSRLGLVWLDFTIHPVRFLPDLVFGMTTNSPEVFARALRYHMPPAVMEPYAALLMATATRLQNPLPHDISILAIGQTSYDRSLIRGGRFLDFKAFASELQTVASASRIAFKPHPYNKNDFGLFESGLRYKQVIFTGQNIYHLLTQPQIQQVVAVSSSVGHEAKFFDKEVVWLAKPEMRIAGPSSEARPGDILALSGSSVVNADFWRTVLSPHADVTSPENTWVDLPPNSLRISLQNFWGYNEMTTDLVPGRGPTATSRHRS